jgi:phenylalanine ammonia-lyase
MEMNPSLVEISGDGLTIAKVASVARLNDRVALASDPGVREKIFASRQLLENKLAAGEIIYGVNTGFGGNARYLIPSSEISKHQENMFQFLACGVGTALPEDTVRAAMLLRANALAKGFSGVRLVLIEKLLDLLNSRITPVVPRYGSVGASGDLIPSAYIARALLSQGEVSYQGTIQPAAQALADAGLEPLRLEAKEALALVNGTTVMSGIGSLVIDDGASLTASVLACVSLGLEALGGTDDPFKDAVHRAKNHPGQITAATFCRELLSASGNVRNLDFVRARLSATRGTTAQDVVRAEESIQSPYSLRCAPQGLGPMLDALEEYRRTLEREANSVNDNPLVDPVRGEIYHTGNFYGGHVARALDGWKIDLATLANWLHALMAMLVDERFSNGLPPNLSPNPGVSTGFKGVQLCLTSLVCALRQLAQPSMIHTLPTEQYNQDMVSLGTHSALTAMDMTAMAQEATAMVLIALCQAIDLRRGANHLGKGNQAIYAQLRSEVAFLDEDRPLDRDIAKVSALIQKRLIPFPDWRRNDEYL